MEYIPRLPNGNSLDADISGTRILHAPLKATNPVKPGTPERLLVNPPWMHSEIEIRCRRALGDRKRGCRMRIAKRPA